MCGMFRLTHPQIANISTDVSIQIWLKSQPGPQLLPHCNWLVHSGPLIIAHCNWLIQPSPLSPPQAGVWSAFWCIPQVYIGLHWWWLVRSLSTVKHLECVEEHYTNVSRSSRSNYGIPFYYV